MSENKKYGYTGKGLRVDLTTGKITVNAQKLEIGRADLPAF